MVKVLLINFIRHYVYAKFVLNHKTQNTEQNKMNSTEFREK